MPFAYDMGQSVTVTAEAITGTIVGRSEYVAGDYMYIVSCDGIERQWNEAALEPA